MVRLGAQRATLTGTGTHILVSVQQLSSDLSLLAPLSLSLSLSLSHAPSLEPLAHALKHAACEKSAIHKHTYRVPVTVTQT